MLTHLFINFNLKVMKNLKVVLNFLPVILLVAATYFFTSGFSSLDAPSKANIKFEIPGVNEESPSTNCIWGLYFLDQSGVGCDGPYTYCINGGTPIVSQDLYTTVSLPCGSTYTICVKAAKGDCLGTTTIVNDCNPCPGVYRIIYMNPSTSECNCSNN